jgi:hypothetical protein
MLSIRLLTPLVVLAAQASFAGPLITPNGAPITNISVLSEFFQTVSWTFSESFTNVEVAVSLTNGDNEIGHQGTAYLMTQIGPGTTVAHELATTLFTFAPVGGFDQLSYVSLFSGLSLGPGSYYVVMTSSESCGACGISAFTDSFTTAPGAAVGSQRFVGPAGMDPYAPASNWAGGGQDLFFTLSGDEVPEPGTILLLGAGLLGLVIARRRLTC